MPYLLDSDVFIQAKNLHYGLDFCPGFWDWIDAANAAGTVFSVESVAGELKDGNDELTEWAASRPSLFIPPDDAAVASLQALARWTTQPAVVAQYTQGAIAEFLSKADYYLVAQAHALGYVVVTHERSQPSKRVIKIPDACNAMGVRSMTPFDMLRLEGATLVLG